MVLPDTSPPTGRLLLESGSLRIAEPAVLALLWTSRLPETLTVEPWARMAPPKDAVLSENVLLVTVTKDWMRAARPPPNTPPDRITIESPRVRAVRMVEIPPPIPL